ncbi:hypothetical protein GIB67_030366 [Kingdonia uniflora]|uniref:Homeobox domain-containing protein n=1 Tax=Kingdonia uniflora TaxID=39325 RepID=A0A7J7M6R7_9MAGN|nr:hypothetical protein GIB67_030366 [Kingdonia uniflora]
MSPVASTRWCPTPGQLMILEELYKGGIRSPSSIQIQHITAQLSLYGKIEGKNVFYWFQNHKARDRQKLRRKLVRQHHHLQQQHLVQYPQFQPNSLVGIQQFHHFNPTQFLPQEGVQVHEASSSQVMNYNTCCTLDHLPQRDDDEIEKWNRLYGRDWMDLMMMMEMSPVTTPPPPCCSTKVPLKTLELFPIKSTNNLKDEYTSSKNISWSTTSN